MLPCIGHHATRVELRTFERTSRAFLAHNRRRLHRERDLHRVRHFVVGFRDRFKADLCWHEVDVRDFRLETEHRRRVAVGGLRRAIFAK